MRLPFQSMIMVVTWWFWIFMKTHLDSTNLHESLRSHPLTKIVLVPNTMPILNNMFKCSSEFCRSSLITIVLSFVMVFLISYMYYLSTNKSIETAPSDTLWGCNRVLTIKFCIESSSNYQSSWWGFMIVWTSNAPSFNATSSMVSGIKHVPKETRHELELVRLF